MKYIKLYERTQTTDGKYKVGDYVMYINKEKKNIFDKSKFIDKPELAEIISINWDQEVYVNIKEDDDELWCGLEDIRPLTEFEKDTMNYNL